MTTLRRVFFRASLFAAFAFVLATAAIPSRADAAGNWEYVVELGGWLDWETGLVWGDRSAIVDRWGPCRWDFTATTFLTQHRIETGIPDWRMATVAELQTIAANEGWRFLKPDLDPTTGSIHAFSSQTPPGKKNAYMVNLVSGGVFVYPKSTYITPLPVYRLFTP